jgi:transcriptional regulator with XRE-family HTH domain
MQLVGGNTMEMHEKIKMLRKQHGLTLQDVGDAVGVGKSTVRKWEIGDIANMKRDKIAALAAALHTTPGYLMGWEDEAGNKTRPPLSERAQAIIGNNESLRETAELLASINDPAAIEAVRAIVKQFSKDNR